MAPVSEDAIVREARDFGLEIDAELSRKLLKLKDYIKFMGRAGNLTGARSSEELDAHIIEGLQVVAVAKRVDVDGPWLDVGSGGGFPGLVLAACLELPITLVEPRAKRASALELGLAKLGRRDCRVLRGRVDHGRWRGIEGGSLEGPFAAASARAVFSPQRWVAEGCPWLQSTGLLFLHLRAGEATPEGVVEIGRVEHGQWAAVAARCST
jgi:16S rRNA (guanine527-N7)-methyltransferase